MSNFLQSSIFNMRDFWSNAFEDVIMPIICVLVFFLMIFAIFFGGYGTGRDNMKKHMQKQAIEFNYAEHDTKTGEWQWKQDLVKEENE